MSAGNISSIQEVVEGLVSLDKLGANLSDGSCVILRGRNRSVGIGKDLLVKVNVNIGASSRSALDAELEKLRHLSRLGYRPDAMMDLSIVRLKKPLYLHMLQHFGGPVGTLPHYLCHEPEKGVDPQLLLEEIARHAEAGVGWVTLHLTPTKELYEEARRTRLVGMASRGGGIVIHDMYLNNRGESVLSLHFDEILQILKKSGVALSIGTAFRPASVVDALDRVHLKEIDLQGAYIREARRQGVQVIMEGVGHITLERIAEYVQRVKPRYGIPLVPLGPIPTDAAVGEDHISSAIGAAYMALIGGADMINSVTRQEHTGGVPSIDSVDEGLRATRIAAHSVNIARFNKLDTALDKTTSEKRARNYTCVVEGGLFTESARMRFAMGCTRCREQCPFLVSYELSNRH